MAPRDEWTKVGWAAFQTRLVAFVGAFLLGLVLVGGVAEACPGGEKSNANATQRLEQTQVSVPSVIVSTARDNRSEQPGQQHPCCAAGCNAHSTACYCGAVAAAISGSSSPLFSSGHFLSLSPFDDAEFASDRPPPDLRPPRRVA